MDEGRFYVPKRYVLVAALNVGIFFLYASRVILSVTLIAMVNNTYSQGDKTVQTECPVDNRTEITLSKSDGTFKWDQSQQGVILSAVLTGYVISQIPGGILATRYGGKWVFGTGIFLSSLLTLMTPFAANMGFYFLYADRMLLGISQGVAFPAIHNMLGKWAPPNEKSRMTAIVYSGLETGSVVSLIVGGAFSASPSLGGWATAYYILGVLGIIWVIAWILCVNESPQKHPSISAAEKQHILDSQKGSAENARGILYTDVPWLAMFTSIRVWAIVVSQFSRHWIYFLVLMNLPTYYKDVLDFSMAENGPISALPYVAGFFVQVGSGFIADYLLIKNYLSVTNVRRVFAMLGFMPTGICFILVGYTGCNDAPLAVTYMVLAFGLSCFNRSSYSVNHLDLSPRFAGILFAFTNCLASIAGVIAPLVTGYFTNNAPTRDNYRKVFWVAAGMCVLGATFFSMFVSGEEQEWNTVSEKRDKTEPSSEVCEYEYESLISKRP